jgi:hypothetical protein
LQLVFDLPAAGKLFFDSSRVLCCLIVVVELIKRDLGAGPSREQKEKRINKWCGGLDAKRPKTNPKTFHG